MTSAGGVQVEEIGELGSWREKEREKGQRRVCKNTKGEKKQMKKQMKTNETPFPSHLDTTIFSLL